MFRWRLLFSELRKALIPHAPRFSPELLFPFLGTAVSLIVINDKHSKIARRRR